MRRSLRYMGKIFAGTAMTAVLSLVIISSVTYEGTIDGKKLMSNATKVTVSETMATKKSSSDETVRGSIDASLNSDWSEWVEKWEKIKNNYEYISLTPGKDISRMNFGWYSKNAGEAKVSVTMNGVEKIFSGQSEKYKKIDNVQYYSNKVTVKGLSQDTSYEYSYLLDGKYTEKKIFKTGNSSKTNILYMTDPQIGASHGYTVSGGAVLDAKSSTRNDAYNWSKNLEKIMTIHPETDFMIQTGDAGDSKDDDYALELDYVGYFCPDVLTGLPVAAVIGNHDRKFANFKNHINVPNPYKSGKGSTKAGYDYYFSYGDGLFIVLDTNNYNGTTHEKLIKKAIKAYPDAKWRIVSMHHDIYGAGFKHSDSDGMVMRTKLTAIFDKYDIDMVLQGHDHNYCRSYFLKYDGKEHIKYNKSNLKSVYTSIKDGIGATASQLKKKAVYLKENECYKIVSKKSGKLTNPDGIVYFDQGSASGSKMFSLLSKKMPFVAKRAQTYHPMYSMINMDADTLTINTYDLTTGKKIDDELTIYKTPIKVKKIKLGKKSLKVKKGKTKTIVATIKPATSSDKIITFKSSNKKIAIVNQYGVVKGKSKGKVKITATCGGKKSVCKVRVV